MMNSGTWPPRNQRFPLTQLDLGPDVNSYDKAELGELMPLLKEAMMLEYSARRLKARRSWRMIERRLLMGTEERQQLMEAEERRQLMEAAKMQQQEAETEKKQKAEDKDLEDIKYKLLKMVQKSQYEEVVKLYQMEPKAHKAKITRSGDTALHIAVSGGKESVVIDLVKWINAHAKGKEVSDDLHPLKMANDRGNIPLHLAASIGNVGMCKCLTLQHPELVGVRNIEGETPLFLAALHGKKDAFLFLHRECGFERGYSYCRRRDGETILHCAIAGEHFDLAYQILQHYEALVNSVNEKGLTPLHILASKPAAFRSGTHLSWFGQIIYNCIEVEKLHKESSTHHNFPQNCEAENYPSNYKTCVHLFQLLGALLQRMFKIFEARRNNNAPASDMENPAKEEGYHCHQLAYVNKLISKSSEMLVILGKIGWGPTDKNKIRVKKQKNIWSVEVMNKLLDREFEYTAGTHGELNWLSVDKDRGQPGPDGLMQKIDEHQELSFETFIQRRSDTPILIAAKNGITEIVEKILELNPGSILDADMGGKNTVLLAVGHRQTQLYEKLVSRKPLDERAFCAVDDEGNTALHLAAALGDYQPYPFAALQMQWELKWYKYVKNSMPQRLFPSRNKANMTPKDIFRESHKHLVEKGGQWLSNTSTSCSVVATLITTVAFATTASIPGGMKENSSRPNLEDHPGFIVFAISSLIGLSLSVTSVITFLVILTSRHHQKDFRRDLPRKLLLALTSLFISLAAMLVCFCAGHFFLLKDQLKFGAFPLYGLACLPVTIFAVMQFPFFFDLVMATLKKVPQRMPYG